MKTLKYFLYKKTCIGTRFKIVVEWCNFFPEFFKGTSSH